MAEVVDYKKVIVKTILISLISVLIALGVFATIMFCAFTKTSADFIYDIGFDRWASQLYYRVYEKDGDMLSCYKALSISIRVGDSDKTIKYYEGLVENSKNSEFIYDIESANRNLQVGILEKSSLLNEEDYLRDNYICALKKQGRVEDAFQYALADFSGMSEINIKDIGLYSLNAFAEGNGLNRFNNVYEGHTETLVSEMQNYFDNLVVLFEDSVTIADEDIEKAYLIALADRIMIVGQDVNKVYLFNENNEEVIANNISNMSSVNEVVKGIL